MRPANPAPMGEASVLGRAASRYSEPLRIYDALLYIKLGAKETRSPKRHPSSLPEYRDNCRHHVTDFGACRLELFFEKLARVPGPPDPVKVAPIFEKYGLERLGPPLGED